ncbi:SAM-dependent methyltransferase [Variovorax boronicumulans]|uniref:class I SAM-dependent methyltransferase n=1 Tax=Variovorax boronicumulans TaxID=436515 RepID=UPI00277F3702|nr:class I SAM-dependent methyltransferase [Variovorax boronicumulans]MDP9908439.1 SAM-dependent methyltransferase [Variovorax boronicumulans]
MDFYDDLAPLYHLIFPDWSHSIRRQGEQLDSVIQSEWPGHRTVLDVSCGIGTQALALAGRGYSVVGSDLSSTEIERARREADLRGLAVDFKVGDMRTAHEDHGTGYDLVISCDNSVPHLLTDEDLLLALRQFLACLRPGGGCVITVRDYDKEERGTNLVKHYGARVEDGKRYVLFQVWDFDGDHYDFSFFVVEDELVTGSVKTRVMRSRYYAIPVERLCELMREAGFENVKRLDAAFYQPVLVGTKPATGSLA